MEVQNGNILFYFIPKTRERIFFISHDVCELPALVFDTTLGKWFLLEVMVLLRSHLKFPLKNLRSTWKAFEKVFLTFFKNYFSILQSEKNCWMEFSKSHRQREKKTLYTAEKIVSKYIEAEAAAKKLWWKMAKICAVGIVTFILHRNVFQMIVNILRLPHTTTA